MCRGGCGGVSVEAGGGGVCVRGALLKGSGDEVPGFTDPHPSTH